MSLFFIPISAVKVFKNRIVLIMRVKFRITFSLAPYTCFPSLING